MTESPTRRRRRTRARRAADPTDVADNADTADAADTPAIAALRASGIPFRVVRTERAGSAEESAALQGIPVEALLRTIVVRRGEDDYLFVLVPAGRRFDWPKLRAHLGVTPDVPARMPTRRRPSPATSATRSPRSGRRSAWPVIVDASVADLAAVVAIGGGAFGVNVHLAPAMLIAALDCVGRGRDHA